jgi:hypothetical protein
MRGKLRDKRSTNRRDSYRFEEGEYRRTQKRTARANQWIDQVKDEDLDFDFEAYEEEQDELNESELDKGQDFAQILPEKITLKKASSN